MTPRELAISRSRAYGLLSHLFLEGITAELVELVRGVPSLSRVIPEPYDPDEAAARHYELFSLNAFPYAGSYLEAEDSLGHATVEAVARRFAESGYEPTARVERADHLGHLLGYLSQAYAWEAARTAQPLSWNPEHLARYIDAYLLSWLPPFVEAVTRYRDPFYTEVAGLALDLILENRQQLAPPTPSLPYGQQLEDDAFGRAGPGELARYLASPARCGLLLSRNDITRLARNLGLPAGFGDRVLMLRNLLSAALRFDQLSGLAVLLRGRLAQCRAYYEALGGPGTEEWLARLDHTAIVLDAVEKAGSEEVQVPG